jgi:hypothetical protein
MLKNLVFFLSVEVGGISISILHTSYNKYVTWYAGDSRASNPDLLYTKFFLTNTSNMIWELLLLLFNVPIILDNPCFQDFFRRGRSLLLVNSCIVVNLILIFFFFLYFINCKSWKSGKKVLLFFTFVKGGPFTRVKKVTFFPLKLLFFTPSNWGYILFFKKFLR